MINMSEKIIQRGAEALIFLDKYDGNSETSIIKRRVKKSYRLTDIDEEIRKIRTRSEAKLLARASKIIDVPEIKNVSEDSKQISMEFIDGKKLSENLDLFPLEEQKKICNMIGQNIAKLHDSDIIHGDLTTSNMIFVKNNENNDEDKQIVNGEKRGDKKSVLSKLDYFKIYFIDFGLGFSSHKIEDKAVDLHLLRQALEARHFRHWEVLFVEVKDGYSSSKNSEKVIEQLKKVETRGRYKSNY
ncbi:MAG: RIO1 family regulatory kinase/ATPase [Nanoarchaeota archaeon]